jgi:hypothetical protein
MGDGKDEDDWCYEGRSMTLRDILVRAGDATFAHFDILSERCFLFISSSRLCTGRTGPEGNTFPFMPLIKSCMTLRRHAKLARLSNV